MPADRVLPCRDERSALMEIAQQLVVEVGHDVGLRMLQPIESLYTNIPGRNRELLQLICAGTGSPDAHRLHLHMPRVRRREPQLALGAQNLPPQVRAEPAIQVHGGAGVSDDFPPARLYSWHRAMRLFDGPDEVHMRTIARAELGREKPPFAVAVPGRKK
jgi:Acyl-CoA dehydrogenase, C-terminal domain